MQQSRNSRMFSCFTPKHLAMAGFLLAAAAVHAAEAPPAASGAGASGTGAGSSTATVELTNTAVTFFPIQDTFAKTNWMGIEVEFDAKPPGKSITDVAVTLDLAWDKPGVPGAVDLILTSTVKLVGVIGGKRNAVFFFVPPETLAHSSSKTPYDASHGPTYYAVQYKVGENTLPMGRGDYSVVPLFNAPENVKKFQDAASNTGNKGMLFSEATAPYYILGAGLQKLGSNTLATFYPAGADAGH